MGSTTQISKKQLRKIEKKLRGKIEKNFSKEATTAERHQLRKIENFGGKIQFLFLLIFLILPHSCSAQNQGKLVKKDQKHRNDK